MGTSTTARKRPKITKEQRTCVRMIKKARRAGWTLTDLATHLGVSFSSISRWEHGQTLPYRNVAARCIPLLEELEA
jgi:transcriptional regulator with XRE-family HTH domain